MLVLGNLSIWDEKKRKKLKNLYNQSKHNSSHKTPQTFKMLYILATNGWKCQNVSTLRRINAFLCFPSFALLFCVKQFSQLQCSAVSNIELFHICVDGRMVRKYFFLFKPSIYSEKTIFSLLSSLKSLLLEKNKKNCTGKWCSFECSKTAKKISDEEMERNPELKIKWLRNNNKRKQQRRQHQQKIKWKRNEHEVKCSRCKETCINKTIFCVCAFFFLLLKKHKKYYTFD